MKYSRDSLKKCSLDGAFVYENLHIPFSFDGATPDMQVAISIVADEPTYHQTFELNMVNKPDGLLSSSVHFTQRNSGVSGSCFYIWLLLCMKFFSLH